MSRTLPVVLISLASLLACGGSSGPSGPDGGPGTGPSVTMATPTCTITDSSNSSFDLGNVVATGTATGAAGSTFYFDISNGGQSTVSIDCGGWTQNGSTANNVSCVAVAGTASINWSVTQQVFWCTSGCDSSPATNNADLTTKYLTARIVDASNANEDSVPLTVTCP